ncbi:hypothetical protein PW683_02485 [Streptomyces niveus]
MAKLIYSMISSLDGYAEAAEGDLGTGAEDQEVHTFVNDLFRPVGTYLYGRRMYETMVYWESAHTEPDQPPHIFQYARDWQAVHGRVRRVLRAGARPPHSAPRTRMGPARASPPDTSATFGTAVRRQVLPTAVSAVDDSHPSIPGRAGHPRRPGKRRG